MAKPVFVTNDVPSASQVNDWFVNILFATKATQTGRNTTTTLADDPDLTLPVVANATYLAQILLRHNSQPAGDFKWTMLGPAGASFDHVGGTIQSLGSVFTDDQEISGQLGDVFSSAGIAGVNTPIRLEGLLITAGTAGNFKLQWAQLTSNAGNSTLLANSFMSLRRVA
jgi:hypothetical protein